MSSTQSAESSKEVLDQLLDAVLYAPVGLFLSAGTSPSELAARGRRQVEAARLLGRMALGHVSPPSEPNNSSADSKPG